MTQLLAPEIAPKHAPQQPAPALPPSRESQLERMRRATQALRTAELRAGVREPAQKHLVAEGLPVPAPLAAAGMRLEPGAVVAVGGSTGLLLALLATASGADRWAAIVGWPNLGVAAAADHGLDLERTVFVPTPGSQAAEVLAAMVDGVDLVAVGPGAGDQVRPAQRRSLLARVRERRGVLFVPPNWPEATLRLEGEVGNWSGLGQGRGYLRERNLRVQRVGLPMPAVDLNVGAGPVGVKPADTSPVDAAPTTGLFEPGVGVSPYGVSGARRAS